jgi:hypothetical protein
MNRQPHSSGQSSPTARGGGQRLSDLQSNLRSYGLCLLCGCGGPPQVLPDSSCAGCGSPLAEPPLLAQAAADARGRRSVLRRARDHLASMHIGWPSPAYAVRWRDLSLAGLSIVAERAVDIGVVIRVSDAGVDALAQVVECRHQGPLRSIHARLLRVRFIQSNGVFFSVKA